MTLCNSIGKNKTYRKTFNKRGSKAIFWKPQNAVENTEKDTNKWKDFP